MAQRRKPADIASHLDAKKQLSAAYYNLHEARLCFENITKIGSVPATWPARIREINELIDYLKRRVLEYQMEIGD